MIKMMMVFLIVVLLLMPLFLLLRLVIPILLLVVVHMIELMLNMFDVVGHWGRNDILVGKVSGTTTSAAAPAIALVAVVIRSPSAVNITDETVDDDFELSSSSLNRRRCDDSVAVMSFVSVEQQNVLPTHSNIFFLPFPTTANSSSTGTGSDEDWWFYHQRWWCGCCWWWCYF
jgi:hypothetical protein